MGQKTHPKMFRLGVIETWDSKWFARHDYPKLLHEDFRVTKFLKDPALSRGHLAHRDRAGGQQSEDQYSHGASRHRDRQKRRRDRKTQRRNHQAHQAGNLHQHSRSAKTGSRRPAGRGKRRVAIRAARRLSPGDEGKRFPRHAHGRPGRENSIAPAGWAVRKSRARSGTARGACRCTRCAPISATASPRRARPTASSALRCGFFAARF